MTYNGWYAKKPNQTKSYVFNMYVKTRFGINVQWLMGHKTQPNPTKSYTFNIEI